MCYKTFCWPKYLLNKHKVGQMSADKPLCWLYVCRPNIVLTNCLSTKHCVGQMSVNKTLCWLNVFRPNIVLTNCLSTKHCVDQMSVNKTLCWLNTCLPIIALANWHSHTVSSVQQTLYSPNVCWQNINQPKKDVHSVCEYSPVMSGCQVKHNFSN